MNTTIAQNLTARGTTQTSFAFMLVIPLFFPCGFSNNLNPILIPHPKSRLVHFAVYIAYFFMAVPAGYLMKRLEYKVGIIFGLLFFSVGVFLFIPATKSYTFLPFELFIIACGLSFRQRVANPCAAAFHSPGTRTQRLNLPQSFRGLAATIAPVKTCAHIRTVLNLLLQRSNFISFTKTTIAYAKN